MSPKHRNRTIDQRTEQGPSLEIETITSRGIGYTNSEVGYRVRCTVYRRFYSDVKLLRRDDEWCSRDSERRRDPESDTSNDKGCDVYELRFPVECREVGGSTDVLRVRVYLHGVECVRSVGKVCETSPSRGGTLGSEEVRQTRLR